MVTNKGSNGGVRINRNKKDFQTETDIVVNHKTWKVNKNSEWRKNKERSKYTCLYEEEIGIPHVGEKLRFGRSDLVKNLEKGKNKP